MDGVLSVWTYLLAYLRRHSLRKGCADVHNNNQIPNCRHPSFMILRPGDSQRQPLLISSSEAVGVRAAHPSEVLLQHVELGLKLTTSFPAPGR